MTVDVDVRFTWWHFFISSYYLSVSNEISFTALKSAEFTQSSGSFNWGGPSAFGVYIFSLCAGMSLFDCFKWVLIDCIVKCRGHSELWQFQWGGTVCLWYLYPYIYWYFLIFSNKLTVSNGFSLMVWKCMAVTFSSSSFKWGGPSAFGICILIYTGISLYFLISWLPLVSTCFLCTGISLYLPIIWLFRMGAHWLHWKV